MGDENTPIYKKVSYKDWERIMQETIQDTYNLLQYYVYMYTNADKIASTYNLSGLVDIIKKHYEEKIINQLGALLDNLDMYNMGRMLRKHGEFYIDVTSRVPVFVYTPPSMKKYLKFSNVEYV